MVHRRLVRFILCLGLLLAHGSAAQSPCVGYEDCLRDLKSPEATKRSSAIFMLGNLKDKRATPSLLALLKEEPDPALRLSALKAIGYLRDRAAVPALTEFLPDRQLQQEAVRALVKIADKSAVEALVGSLNDESVQLSAAQGLGEIADPSTKPALIALLRRTDDPRVRGIAAVAIQRINSIWGPSEEEMGVPIYPKSEFLPNPRAEWIFLSKDPLNKVSDFFKIHLKKEPMTFPVFKKRYESAFGEAQEGAPSDRPSLIFVTQEQRFEGKPYPSKMIFLQTVSKETEIKIFNALGESD